MDSALEDRVRKHWYIQPFPQSALESQQPDLYFLKIRLEDPALEKLGKDIHILTFRCPETRMIWLVTEKLINGQAQLSYKMFISIQAWT